jgi:hypothetical protein
MNWSSVCGAGIAANGELSISGSHDARLMVAIEPTLEHMEPVFQRFEPRGPNFNIDYDHSGAPSGMSESDVRASIARAVAQYEGLLAAENFTVTLQLRWGNFAGVTLMSTSPSGRDDRAWNSVFVEMTVTQFGIDEDPYEQNINLNLPNGSTVPYRWGSNSTTSTSRIQLPIPLLKKWYGAAANDPILIEMDSTLDDGETWDLDLADGLPLSAYDFEGALAHEIGHGLGFVSELETAQNFFNNFISTWDIFRFETSESPIDDTEMSSAARNLRPAIPACGCTALFSSSQCFELSRGDTPGGDGNQASHWRDFFIDNPNYIGLMDPIQRPGERQIKEGKYLQDADIRAFDLMGYEIDLNSVTPGVQAITNPSPVSGATVPAGALTVTWDSASFATSYDLYVDCSSCLVTYVQRNIVGTSHTIPAGILQSGPYTILVTSRNWRGFVSTPISITVAGSQCDSIDFNNNGAFPEDQDVTDFFSVLAGGPCSPGNTCNDIDFNNNGAFPEDQDVIDFFNVLAGGACP